jgi:hypothetical protein
MTIRKAHPPADGRAPSSRNPMVLLALRRFFPGLAHTFPAETAV